MPLAMTETELNWFDQHCFGNKLVLNWFEFCIWIHPVVDVELCTVYVIWSKEIMYCKYHEKLLFIKSDWNKCASY